MIFLQIIKRELKIATRKQAEILNPLWFFLIVITLFPLVIGPDPKLLSRIAPGIAWVAALLSALLSFERLFRDDFIDGSLEQLMLTAQPLALTALAKVVAHWLLTGLPLILLSPIAALLLSLEVNIWWALVLTLLVGTPILSCIGAIGVALTVGLRKGGVLLSLLCPRQPSFPQEEFQLKQDSLHTYASLLDNLPRFPSLLHLDEEEYLPQRLARLQFLLLFHRPV